jgi:hypothetical protein
MKEPADVVPGIMAIQNTGQVPTTWTGWCTGQDAGNAMVTAVIGGQWLPSQTWPQQADCCHQARKQLKNNLHGAQGERLQHRYK